MSILTIFALNIILPTIDILSDINLVYLLYRGAYACQYRNSWHPERDDYEKCEDDPDGYCSNDENNKSVCRLSSHPKMATAMLTPFLLNYIVCFITFLRKEKNKKFTFIFALLNLFPQFGKNNHQEKSLE